MRIKTKHVRNFKNFFNPPMLFEKLYFVCDHQYLSILLLPERKINGERKTAEKA